MKVSKPVLIFGIVVLLIAGYVHFFTGKKKPKGPVPPPVQAGAPAKPGQPGQQAGPPQGQVPPPQAGQQSPAKPADAAAAPAQPKPRFDKIDVSWGSDPFALPVFKEKRKKDAGSAVRLVAILEKGGSRVAVIDKDVVKKGDTIGNEKVVEIGKDRVVLARGGVKRTLVLADPDTLTQESASANVPAKTPPNVPAKEESPPKEKATERAK